MRLFGPEHGLSGAGADGEAMRDDVDFLTGLPTFSLYGDRMRPTREMLQGLDAILFDIPDIGARFYTFIWTLHHVLSAAEEFGVPVVVLDRPNPLGGLPERVEGPLLDLAHRSFIGNDVIPIRHSLTVGELARLWQSERFPRLSLRVIPVHGWTRDARWPSLGSAMGTDVTVDAVVRQRRDLSGHLPVRGDERECGARHRRAVSAVRYAVDERRPRLRIACT